MRGAQHQHRLQRFGRHGGFRRTKHLGESQGRGHFELVIVVPSGFNADAQKISGDVGAPPCLGRGIGEVQIGPDSVPELRPGWLAVGVEDQQTFGQSLVKQGMIVQQAGFDIRTQAYPGLAEATGETGRIREFFQIPIEDISTWPNRGVATGEVEAVTEHVVLAAVVYELRHLRLSIRGVGIAHGRARISEGPARQKRRSARQPGEAAGDIGYFRTCDDIVIERPSFRRKATKQAVIIAALRPKVEAAIGIGVIEQAKGQSACLIMGDVERNVFVERV